MYPILSKETDKQGNLIDIKYAFQIGASPVIPFFMKNYSELIDAGFAHPVMVATNKSKAIYAEHNGKVIGHIVFEYLEDQYKTTWIYFSCVEDSHRQCGIYKMMHRQLILTVKKQGSMKIASFVHVDNKRRQASCSSVGMKPVYYRMEQDLID
jgi:hypothetical protein